MRRLQIDIVLTGWWVLIALTVIGVFVLIYWACKKGTPGPNIPEPIRSRLSAKSPRVQQSDRLVAGEQIEQIAQRLPRAAISAFASRAEDRSGVVARRRQKLLP